MDFFKIQVRLAYLPKPDSDTPTVKIRSYASKTVKVLALTLALTLALIGVAATLLPRMQPAALAAVEKTGAKAGVELLSVQEFRDLAEALAPKVNLFRDAWRSDRKAEFYGGTTRDFLYWIKGRFRGIKTREEALDKAKELEAISEIDVRDFIAPASDVDVISSKELTLDADRYGIRKIDSRDDAVFDPKTAEGQNELRQGYVPAEKIRLSSKGFGRSGEFGDGLSEIYDGRLTVHFTDPEVFATSHYAREKLNHPILLALRYLRLLAVNYYQENGRRYPNMKRLLDIDPASKAAVEKVIRDASDGKALTPYLRQKQFKKWINGSIQKAHRSFTNPTAAHALMEAFGVDRLVSMYKLQPIHQYLFAKYRDPAIVERNLAAYGVKEGDFYRPVKEYFPNGLFYHGTRSEEAFRDILLLGVMKSKQGSGGEGLYGVAEKNQRFARKWADHVEHVVTFQVDPRTKLVDITRGEGRRVWNAFHENTGKNESAFANAFGVDIIRYPYATEAFVAKNSDVLTDPRGVYRQVMTLSTAISEAEKVRTVEETIRYLSSLSLSRFNAEETDTITESLGKSLVSKGVVRPEDRQVWTSAFRLALKVETVTPRNPDLAILKRTETLPDGVIELLGGRLAYVKTQYWTNWESPEYIRFLAKRSPRALIPYLRAWKTIEMLVSQKTALRDPDVQKAVTDTLARIAKTGALDKFLVEFVEAYRHENKREEALLRKYLNGYGAITALQGFQGVVATDPSTVREIARAQHPFPNGELDEAKLAALYNQKPEFLTNDVIKDFIAGYWQKGASRTRAKTLMSRSCSGRFSKTR